MARSSTHAHIQTHINAECSCSLNQYCILSQPTVKVKAVYVCKVDLRVVTRTSLSVCVCAYKWLKRAPM